MNRNYSDISYAESPFGTLSEFMSKTFGWMFAGLLVTFLVGIGAVTTGLIYPLITSGLFILTSIAELVLVFVLSARVQTLQPSTATGIFFAYAVLNGLNLSSIFLAYDFGSLILAFLVGAVYFGVMAVYGNVTNRDLTGWGPKLMGGLVALILVSILGMFIPAIGNSLLLSYVGILLFCGITAWDMQRVMSLYYQTNGGYGQTGANLAIYGAFELYLDFINLFLRILSVFGNRRRN